MTGTTRMTSNDIRQREAAVLTGPVERGCIHSYCNRRRLDLYDWKVHPTTHFTVVAEVRLLVPPLTPGASFTPTTRLRLHSIVDKGID